MFAELLNMFWTQRSTFEVQFVGAATLAFVVGFVFLTNSRTRLLSFGNREVWMIGALWTLVCTAQYWIFGPNSILGHSDEQSAGVPWIYFLTRVFPGGSYMHAWSGGSDSTAAVIIGTQYVSVEWILFTLFPPWIALFLMKAGTIAIAFSGGYVFARRGANLSVGKAIVLGMLAGVGNILNIGWALGGNGWGFALLPWMFYVLAMTTEKPFYFLRVAVLGMIFSASSSIFHQLPLSYVAVGLSAFLFPPKFPKKFLLGCVLVGFVGVLNWLEVLNAIIQLGHESARSTTVPVLPYSPMFMIVYKIKVLFDFMVVPVGLFSLALLAIRKDPLFRKALVAYLVAIGLGSFLTMFNWSATGITFLAAYRWHLFSYGDSFVILAIAALALKHVDWSPKSFRRFTLPAASALYLSAIAVAAASDHKVSDIERFHAMGGQEQFLGAALLKDRSWRPNEPFRVVTLSRTLSPNMSNAYGLDTFDGVSNSYLRRADFYYGLAVQKPAKIMASKSYHWLTVAPDTNVFSTAANTDGLRVANVRFVISDRKLEDPAFVNVISPTKEDPNPHFVHELKNPWPRVFIPAALKFSAFNIEDERFYAEFIASSELTAVVSAEDTALAPAENMKTDSFALKDYRLVGDGFDIEVERRAQGEKGLLVVNVPYSKFWKASSNGHPLRVFPVNGIHTAIVIDESGPISLRYERPKVF